MPLRKVEDSNTIDYMTFDIYNQKALELVEKGENLFITGKAGTGKTTLLKEIVARLKASKKIVAVTAPTGVAAHNAEGVTLHSLLHIPLCVYLPEIKIPELYSLHKSDIEVVNKLEVLIIDEISMVRCDLLDAVDDIMRHYRCNKMPFGGVQVIMIGDLFQLMPVVTEEDEEMLRSYYRKSFYFFDSKVMKKLKYSVIELKTIYRQDKRSFIKLLNRIRLGKLTEKEQEKLRSIYCPIYEGINNDKQIVLTTHNWMANSRNEKRLSKLENEVHEFMASAYGWPRYIDYPAKFKLKLKVGARVMFIQNLKGSYYNGMLGTVEDVDEDYITVRADDGNKLINVFRYKWTYEKYHLNKKTKVLEIVRAGTFAQFPLKLAWAITIHKSQGLTFDHVVIDAGKAFAPGQVYVALSRCRSFENIKLLSEITPEVVKIDPDVTDYLRRVKSIEIEEPKEKKVENPKEVKKTAENKRAKISKTLKTTLELFERGYSPEQIAVQRKLTLGTIVSHFATLVASDRLSIHEVLEDSKIQQIEKAIKKANSLKLTLIKENCPDNITYHDIKIVAECHQKKGE